MKKIILALLVAVLLMPTLALSAPNLASRLQGKILLAAQDHGKTYYVHSDGKKYRVDKDTAQKIFEKLALGITNENLNEIPEGSVGISPTVAENSTVLSVSNVTSINWETKYKEVLSQYQGYQESSNCTSQEDEISYWQNKYNSLLATQGGKTDQVEPKKEYTDYVLKTYKGENINKDRFPLYFIYPNGRSIVMTKFVIQVDGVLSDSYVGLRDPNNGVYGPLKKISDNKWEYTGSIHINKNLTEEYGVPLDIGVSYTENYTDEQKSAIIFTPLFNEWVIKDTDLNKYVRIEQI